MLSLNPRPLTLITPCDLTMRIRSILLTVLLCVPTMSASAQARPTSPAKPPASDTAFAAMQQRGKQAMGVDQYTSVHLFDALPDGGRIELQRETNDSAGVAQIRAH